MTREEAAEILKHEKDYDAFVSDYRNKVHEALDMAIQALEQESGWISVSEKLPKPYKRILRTVKSFGWSSTVHIHVDIGTICPVDTNVIAWMPLPKPYESQEREAKTISKDALIDQYITSDLWNAPYKGDEE